MKWSTRKPPTLDTSRTKENENIQKEEEKQNSSGKIIHFSKRSNHHQYKSVCHSLYINVLSFYLFDSLRIAL